MPGAVVHFQGSWSFSTNYVSEPSGFQNICWRLPMDRPLHTDKKSTDSRFYFDKSRKLREKVGKTKGSIDVKTVVFKKHASHEVQKMTLQATNPVCGGAMQLRDHLNCC
jgi:hypothetical protein